MVFTTQTECSRDLDFLYQRTDIASLDYTSFLYPGIRWLPTGGEDIQPETFTYVKYKQGLVVAGVPIGSDEFIKDFLDSVSADTLKLSQAIDTLKSSDFERQTFLLDFYCLRPRVNHIFRGLPPRYLPDFASDHDTLMRDAISKTLGLDSMERWRPMYVDSAASILAPVRISWLVLYRVI